MTDGWYTYGSIMRTNQELIEQERVERPFTCPVDGYTLEDVRGVLHCAFGGEVYDYAGQPAFGYQM